MIDPFAAPPRLPLVAPSILAADFARLGEDCRDALDRGGDLLHVDIMDGHFVPNLSMGPAVCEAARKACPDAFLDVHLMVTDPDDFVDPFIKAGANLISFHIEVREGSAARELIRRIHGEGLRAGIALNPDTPAERIMPFVDIVDLVVVMSVFPGFGGQAFIPEVLSKADLIRPAMRADQRLEIDGGIGPQTAPQAIEAGFDLLVAGSAVFGRSGDDRTRAIGAIRDGTGVGVGR
ncbi:MAG: ribulose-phosphate 3-epimerase [Phycisphaerales bacterium]|nr:ribulose-phosphate 3-epimerase [Phycisphaerales bacterium]